MDDNLPPDDLPVEVGDEGAPDHGAASNVVHIAPIVARKVEARSLYWRGWDISQIAQELGIPYATVASWKVRQKWDEASAIQKAGEGTLQRYQVLIAKEKKTGSDYKEIDLLGRQFERFARVEKYLDGGNETDLNPKVRNRNTPEVKAKKEKAKNLITPEMTAQLRADLEGKLFGYQKLWLSTTSLQTRMILKSRQIGATWYFARERLLRALETGNPQIFISASRAQANVFRTYIIQWVRRVLQIELKGDPIVIQRGEDEDGEALESVELYFLGTNYRTAQSYHGDVIIDECFWIYGFEELYAVASAMSTHDRYSVTLFSTPSTLAHEAYPMWCGDRFNSERPKHEKVKLDITHDALKGGALGPDEIWRQIVSIEDAVESGFDLATPEKLQKRYSVTEYQNLFLCQFLDDSQTMFPFNIMRRCMVDSWEVWKRDFQPYALRPFGNGEVWIGYDPNASESATADDAALVVVAPPQKAGGKFRVLEKKRLKGLDFEGQAAAIKAMAGKYNVTKIGIDTTGAGRAVHALVCKWFPMAHAYQYSVPLKTSLVLKAKNVISAGRLEFESSWNDMATSFMAIKPETKGNVITFTASRGGGVGHADLAWAVMHALYFEPLDSTEGNSGKSTMEIW
ncbi:terminase family protein [Novosphingobium sp.]|uniref:terminase large subunit domain-containing protein n=1 Tax=Novosphingobium sp. TaxID=1874826 RepID=UPI0031D626F2